VGLGKTGPLSSCINTFEQRLISLTMSAAYVYRDRCDIKILPSVFDIVFMQKTVSGLLAIICLACCPLANASSSARVTATASPAWIHKGEDRIGLAAGREIAVGDRVTSGENGRIEIELWSRVRLRVYPESEISVMNGGNSDLPPLLKLHLGRICLESPPASSRDTKFGLNVDDLLLVTFQQYGHICASRHEEMSVINLRAGSVQIDNEVEPGIVILSEAGTVFQMDDDGAYQLLSLVDESEVADMHQQPFISAQKAAQPAAGMKMDEQQEVVAEADAITQAISENEPAEAGENTAITPAATDDYVYTVYLFSTRSEEVAERVSREFQKAGHETRILVREGEDPARYRIAVSGFESRESASEFAAAIVGTLGIRDTWIGKDRPAANE